MSKADKFIGDLLGIMTDADNFLKASFSGVAFGLITYAGASVIDMADHTPRYQGKFSLTEEQAKAVAHETNEAASYGVGFGVAGVLLVTGRRRKEEKALRNEP